MRITAMLDAVREAVVQARTPVQVNKWIDLPDAPEEAEIEELIARSKADILKEASQAMIAQANQTRESVTSLLQAAG